MTCCPYSEEALQEWDSVANPMGDACFTCDNCDCVHWFGSCEGCEKHWKWHECGGMDYHPSDDYPAFQPKKRSEINVSEHKEGK